MDARQLKSRELLREAMLPLAATRPTNEISVSEISAAARVNRSTFYEHAASPSALLENVLRAELDELREQYLRHVTAQTAAVAMFDVTRAVLEHVVSHEAIYRFGLSESSVSASLQPMLSSHFEASIRLLVSLNAVSIEDDTERLSSPMLLTRMGGRFIADGTVGAISAWLAEPGPRSIDVFLHAYRQLLPSWWPMVDQTAATSSAASSGGV